LELAAPALGLAPEVEAAGTEVEEEEVVGSPQAPNKMVVSISTALIQANRLTKSSFVLIGCSPPVVELISVVIVVVAKIIKRIKLADLSYIQQALTQSFSALNS
jgi:hypothetical protein